MKEILIISGIIMLFYSYQSLTKWHNPEDKRDGERQNNRDLSEKG